MYNNIYEQDEFSLIDITQNEDSTDIPPSPDSDNALDPNLGIDHPKYVKVLNESDFVANFDILYSLNNQEVQSSSGEIYNGFTIQISLSKDVTSIYLIIKALDDSMKLYPIYKKDIMNFTTLSLKLSGTLKNPIVSTQD